MALSLHALSAAALILLGLFPYSAQAAEDEEVDFQYSHYQEGKRAGTRAFAINENDGTPIGDVKIRNKRNPIEVDSILGKARVSLTDRLKFAFNYIEDTWSGATPIGSAPEYSNAFRAKPVRILANGTPVYSGASPYTAATGYFDNMGNPLRAIPNPDTGETHYIKDKAVHVLSYASPETRKQGDFKLSYEWDETAINLGGGISIERDYESRFVNAGGRMDFNQKQTTLNFGLSYTNSDISAVLPPEGNHYIAWTDQHNDQLIQDEKTGLNTLTGTRQDWSLTLGLSQVLNKNALLELGMGFTRSTGFLENPYKLSWFFAADPEHPFQQNLPEGVKYYQGEAFIEQRPDERNQFNWNARLAHYIEPLDAALHFGYSFNHDDWDINAHTFEADWVQPLGWGWVVTPRVRYYSQDAAFFYQPYYITAFDQVTKDPTPLNNFSSDQRLSSYGTLSGGITVSKEFTKGLRLETGFEYYTHKGSLKLGGGGEQDFANFNYWMANAALKINLDALGRHNQGNAAMHSHHANHPNIPAGVMFGHTLDKAGDMMAGYRYQHSQQAGNFLHGDRVVSEQRILAKGCPGTARYDEEGLVHFDGSCSLLPKEMTMSMHMLDLMYAPTDWLTLMLMPQFMDIQMPLYSPESLDSEDDHDHGAHLHETGGIGDTGMYALVKLFDQPNHHLHASMGFTAPTGDAGIKLKEGTKNLDGAYIHYGMQLGSGTWDFKPSLTYTGEGGDWNWGAQVVGTKRLENRNVSAYVLGDMFESSVWGGYRFTNWLSASVRASYSWQDRIRGRYPRRTHLDYVYEETCTPADFTNQAEYKACLADIQNQIRANDASDRPSPMDYPANYGGQYVDLGLGISATVPDGSLAGNRLAFEWLQPVYTNVNGYQLDRDGALSFT